MLNHACHLDLNGRQWYKALAFHCPVSNGVKPNQVSIVTSSCAKPTRLLLVRSADPPERYTHNFTVCLSPLNYNYSRAYEMVEWIELNRILGADKFIVYNHTSASNIASVLDYYASRGIVEVIQWQIPLKVDTWPPSGKPDIHYFGQVAVLEDCLCRTKSKSKYVVNVDLDEFLIPKQNKTWTEIIQRFPAKTGALTFRNAFFRKEWNDSQSNFTGWGIAKKYQLVTLLKTRREKTVLPSGNRSKYIARTDVVNRLTVHLASKLSAGYVDEKVPPDVGMLHHYRNWLVYDDPENIKMDDKTVVNTYAQQLTGRVARIWDTLVGVPLDLHTVP